MDCETLHSKEETVAFGNFAGGYEIIDRGELQITLDPYTCVSQKFHPAGFVR